MPQIRLARSLEDYFAFSETTPSRAGRRFSITLPYLHGARLDRLQWWWHVTEAQERLGGDEVIQALRRRATERFRRHVERWLENTGQRLYGDGPIPIIGVATEEQAFSDVSPPETPLQPLAEPLSA